MPTMRNGGDDGADGRRSSSWFDRGDLDGFLHRSWLKSTGVGDDTFRGRPVIGICNSWSELVNCNVHLRGLAEAVKRGVLQAGGFPREFPVLSTGESLMKPTAMLYRNLMAMDVEESIRSYALDGVVLLTGAVPDRHRAGKRDRGGARCVLVGRAEVHRNPPHIHRRVPVRGISRSPVTADRRCQGG